MEGPEDDAFVDAYADENGYAEPSDGIDSLCVTILSEEDLGVLAVVVILVKNTHKISRSISYKSRLFFKVKCSEDSVEITSN